MKTLNFLLVVIIPFFTSNSYAQTVKKNDYEQKKLTYNTFYVIKVRNKTSNYSLHNEKEGLSNPNSTANGLVEATSKLVDESNLFFAGNLFLWGIEKNIDPETGFINFYKTDSTIADYLYDPAFSTRAEYKQVGNTTQTWQQHVNNTNTIAEQKNDKKRYTCSDGTLVFGKNLDDEKMNEPLKQFSPKIRYNPKNKRAELIDWFVPLQITNMDTTCIRNFVKGGDKEKCTLSSSTNDATDEVKQKLEAMTTIVNSWTTLLNCETAFADGEMRLPAYKPKENYTNAGEFLANAFLTTKIFDFYSFSSDKSSTDYFRGKIEETLTIKEVKTNQINQDAYWQNVYEDQNVRIQIDLTIEIGLKTFKEASDLTEYSLKNYGYSDNLRRYTTLPSETKNEEVTIIDLPKWIIDAFNFNRK